MTAVARATYTLRGAQEKLGLSRTVLVGLIGAGFVTPSRGPRNEHRFTFQDLLLLRTAHALQRSHISPRKILKSLATLKARLPAELPLTGLRITSIGADVAVRAGDGRLEAASGQLLMDFEVATVGGSVTFLERAVADTSPGADDHFRRGESLEAIDAAAAEAAYRQALEAAPNLVGAYLNLGALLCESGRPESAVDLYDAALHHAPGSALVRFNRALALEDSQRLDEAIASYEASLALDSTLADAHFNLGRLQEQRGDARGALRHFNAYRRLQR